jgi:hypothetical protein
MRTRLAAITTAAAAAALVAGCGGGGGSATGGDSAAGLVPADAALLVSVNTDSSSGQIRSADDVLAKFPIRDEVLEYVRKAIREYGIDVDALRRSAGPQLDVAVLDRASKLAVGFARPADEKRFDRILDRKKLLHVRKSGWTVFAKDERAIDEVKHADEKLTDLPAYEHATAKLPDAAIAKAYVAGHAVPDTKKARWASAALLSHDDGFELQVHVNGRGLPGGKSYAADLADDIPEGSVAALSFHDLGEVLRGLGITTIPLLGIPIADLADALDGEGVLYVRPSGLIPEVTLVTKRGTGAATIDRIVRAVAPANARPTKTTIEGVTLNELALGPVTILYGAVEGKLVVTDNANAIRALKTGDRPNLADDDATFKAVRDVAHMPDETNGWLYLNVEDGLPLVEAIAQLANRKLPGVWLENLRAVRSALVYGTREADTQTLVAFVQTA